MAIEKMESDMNIVQKLVIPGLDTDMDIIQKLDDEPNDVGGLTAQALKAKFDESGNIIQRYINETLLPKISGTVAEEENRAQNEQTRQEQEQTRQEQETERQTAEGARAEAERTRETNEQGRTAAEQLRTDAENGREQAEALRSAAEETRAAAEKERSDSEARRKTAENARIDGEKVRQSSETDRIGAETERIASEKERRTAETTREGDEEKRHNAEMQRDTAERARATAEETRESNERSRENREAERQTAEAERAEAEQARKTAESERALAEEKRAAAETARAVFEPYDGTKVYVPGNKVAYGGSSYLNQKACNGITPTDTEYWLLIAKKGADGEGTGDMVKATYDPQGKAQDVFAYTDRKIAAIPTPDVSRQIETHNTAENAHAEKFAKYLPLSGGTMTGAIFAPETKELAVGYGSDTTGYATYKLTRFIHTLSSAAGGTVSRVVIDPERILLENGNVHLSVGLAGVEVSYPLRSGSGAQVPNLDYVDALKTKAHKVSLTVAGWDSSTKRQTVSVAGVVANETAQQIIPMPAAASMTAYNDAGIQCVAQAAGKLTFQCETIPTVDVPVYISITPVNFVS